LIAVLHLTDNEEKIDEIIKNIVEGESTKWKNLKTFLFLIWIRVSEST
jgi:hypothetical protein